MFFEIPPQLIIFARLVAFLCLMLLWSFVAFREEIVNPTLQNVLVNAGQVSSNT